MRVRDASRDDNAGSDGYTIESIIAMNTIYQTDTQNDTDKDRSYYYKAQANDIYDENNNMYIRILLTNTRL